jgi:hypothetical protein
MTHLPSQHPSQSRYPGSRPPGASVPTCPDPAEHCRRNKGLGLSIWDGRNIKNTAQRTEEIVIVQMAKV